VGLYKEACNLSEAELREKGGKGYFGIHGKYSYSFYMVFHFAVIKPLKEHFDYVFIDSPPQMSEVTKMIFLASTHIISPLSPSEYEINTAKTLLLDLDAAFEQNKEAIESGVLPKKEVKFLLINRQASRQLSSNISDKLSRHLNDNMLLKPDFDANAAVEKCSSIRETAVTVNRKYYKDIIGRNSSDDLKRLTDNLTDIAVKIRNFII
jgi:cellulose biosynthesis protein BcsQ